MRSIRIAAFSFNRLYHSIRKRFLLQLNVSAVHAMSTPFTIYTLHGPRGKRATARAAGNDVIDGVTCARWDSTHLASEVQAVPVDFRRL
jgi:hypothetical protein